MSDNETPPRLRVLIVENDPEWREDHVRNLNKGYEVFVAEPDPSENADKFETLREDALAKMNQHCCHLAVVDMRLKRDDDNSDTTGLALVPELAPAVSVIVSGFGDMKTVRKALSQGEVPQRAFDFVGKEDGPAELKNALHRAQKQHWPRQHVSIDWSRTEYQNGAVDVNNQVLGEASSATIDEINNILRHLFEDAKETISLSRLNVATKTPTVTLRPRSVVLRAWFDNKPGNHVVKIARKERIQKEAKGFKEIKDDLEEMRTSFYHPPASLCKLGAFKYTFLNFSGRGVTFRHFYRKRSYKTIIEALESFQKLWGTLYKKSHSEHHNWTMYEAYRNVWGENWSKKAEDYRSELSERDTLAISLPYYNAEEAQSALLDPIKWLADRNRRGNGLFSFQTAVYLARGHGDLHGDNLLVDSIATVWVIDFERAGVGPVSQDWAELETDVLTRLSLSAGWRKEDFVWLAVRLFAPHQLGAVAVEPRSIPWLNKAWHVISKIRELAAQSANSEQAAEQYYWGLLFNAIFRLGILLEARKKGIEANVPKNQSKKVASEQVDSISRCYLMAALLCHRLENWSNEEEAWPPEAWREHLDSDNPQKLQPLPPDLLTPGHSDTPTRPQLEFRLVEKVKDQFKVMAIATNRQPAATTRLPYEEKALAMIAKLLADKPVSSAESEVLNDLAILDNEKLKSEWFRSIGSKLFEVLIPAAGGVRTAYDNRFPGREGGILSIMFERSATALAAWPWEMIDDGYATDHPRREIDVVRYIESDREAPPLTVSEKPCRILYFSARPTDQPALKSENGMLQTQLETAIDPGQFELKMLPDGHYATLRERLLSRNESAIHILHFDGHGDFGRLCPACEKPNRFYDTFCHHCQAEIDHISPEGFLLFEKEDGTTDRILARELLDGIGRTDLRLVVFSSCRSGYVQGAGQMMAGIGPGLILAGVPAVVAMQTHILDQEAVKFNNAFYTALASDSDLIEAVSQARIRLKVPYRFIPSLYLRSRDGQSRLCATTSSRE